MDLSCQRPATQDPHDSLMENNDKYRSARRLKIGGTVIMGVAGGLGAMVGILGTAVRSNSTNLGDTITGDILMVVGFSVLGAFLAAGIPMVVVGNSRQKPILQAVQPENGRSRRLVPMVGFAFGRTGGAASATWRF